jgi:hypothetical protein
MVAKTWRLTAGRLPSLLTVNRTSAMRKITIFSLVVILSGLLGGCHTPPPRTAAAKAKGKDKNPADEYVWYTPTGTHLPIYIKKSELIARENTKSDQEAMRDATRRGLHMDRTGD